MLDKNAQAFPSCFLFPPAQLWFIKMSCLKFSHPLQREQVPANCSGQHPAAEAVKTLTAMVTVQILICIVIHSAETPRSGHKIHSHSL